MLKINNREVHSGPQLENAHVSKVAMHGFDLAIAAFQGPIFWPNTVELFLQSLHHFPTRRETWVSAGPLGLPGKK